MRVLERYGGVRSQQVPGGMMWADDELESVRKSQHCVFWGSFLLGAKPGPCRICLEHMARAWRDRVTCRNSGRSLNFIGTSMFKLLSVFGMNFETVDTQIR